jgi:hypothetical protein
MLLVSFFMRVNYPNKHSGKPYDTLSVKNPLRFSKRSFYIDME